MDVEAFVAGAWERLYRTAFTMTGDRAEAEDAVQEALAIVVDRWSRLSRHDEMHGYAHRVLTRLIWRRASRRRGEAARMLLLRPPPHDTGGMSRVDDRETLRASLAALPPRMRAVVVLRFYADMTERQTADALGCSVGTVKSQANAGLARLRSALLPRTSEEPV